MAGIPLTRRALLNATLAGAASLSLSPLLAREALARKIARPKLTVTRLADDLLLIEGAGGNVVVHGGDQELLMVDGGVSHLTDPLLQRIAAETGNRPVKTILNTHWHWDHTGANETLARDGATLIAHENTRLWLGAEIHSQWEQRTYPPRPPAALPNQTFFYDSKFIELKGEQIEYGYLPQAHTDGDIYVFFPTHNVMVAGDVIAGERYPIVDYSTNGWIGGMIAGLNILLEKTEATTRFVPGRGTVRSRADVQAQLELCETMIKRISASYYRGETWEEFAASKPTSEFDARWGDPTTFLRTAYESAWGHINEIRRYSRSG